MTKEGAKIQVTSSLPFIGTVSGIKAIKDLMGN